MPPLVSVIVPNYNHAPFLKQRLNSVFNQSFQDFEVILLDDKSTDNSVEILTEYATRPQVSHLVVNKQNSGSPFAQWKKGIDLARGEYIWIAESDDMAELNFLETMIGFLNEKVGIAYCRSLTFLADGRSKNMKFWPDIFDELKWKSDFTSEGMAEINSSLVYINIIPNASSCVFKRALALPFPPIINFKYTGDWYFWMYVFQKTHLYFHSQPLNHFRTHSSSSRSRQSKKNEIKKLKEYLYCIDFGMKTLIAGGNKNVKLNYSKYYWIYNGILKKRGTFGLGFIFPPHMPFTMRINYYVFLTKKLLKI